MILRDDMAAVDSFNYADVAAARLPIHGTDLKIQHLKGALTAIQKMVSQNTSAYVDRVLTSRSASV